MTALVLTAPLAASPAAYPEGPLWTWPRGAAMPAELRPGDGPCVCVTYGSPTGARVDELRAQGLRLVREADDETTDRAAVPIGARYLPVTPRWLAVTAETIDPAWWRDRVPGVAYELELWPDGMDHPGSARRIATVGADEQPAPVVVQAPEWVTVALPGGATIRAQRQRGGGYVPAMTLDVVRYAKLVRETEARVEVAARSNVGTVPAVHPGWSEIGEVRRG